MRYTFTFWDSRYSTEAKLKTSSWFDWAKELSEMVRTDKKKSSLPGLVLGKMIEGDRRTNKNVKTIEALALDVERNPDFDTAEAYLARLEHALERIADLEYVAYTTYSHTEAEPRLRLIFPLAKPIAPNDYKPAMSYLNNLTGSVADLNAQKLSQPVYLPRCPPDSTSHWATHHEGNVLTLNVRQVQEVVELRSSLGEGLGKAPMDAHVRQSCKAVLLGRPYAEKGNRDETATRIAWHLSKRHADSSLEAIEEVFYWSCWSMDTDAPTPENIHSKLERGLEKRMDELSEPAASKLEPDDVCVVQHRGSYYFRLKGGGFSRAFTKEESRLAAYKHLRGMPGVQLNYMTSSGATKRKTVESLIEQYGDLADDVVIDLRLPEATFQKGLLSEATVQWPKRDPLYDAQINTWLELLGGEKLKDWLSILADLDRLSSALVIMGPRNIGKTLLAMGCASRFGSRAPAKQHALTGRFQEELARCPLVYIDEDIEDNPYDRNFLSTIRSELSIRERSVNRKYLAPLQMNGAIRCIISANHLPFRQKDSQTGQDLQAIAERFYWINTGGEPAQYLKKVGHEKLNYWRKEGLYRHIMHLEDTRSIPKDSRFGVSGESEKLADLINISVRWNSWVTEWICNGVMDGFAKLNTGDKDIQLGAVIHQKEVYVRVRTVVKAWERYLQNIRMAPDTRPISEALRGIACPDKKYKPKDIGVSNGNNQLRYYKIRRSPLLTFLAETGAGTAEELLAALERGNTKGV